MVDLTKLSVFTQGDAPYENCDVINLHNLHLTSRHGAQLWEYQENANTIRAIRGAKVVTVPTEQLAEIIARDMHFRPYVVPYNRQREMDKIMIEAYTQASIPDPPSVTVVISCYNKASTVGRTIESILHQKFQAEIVVVDDGSTDGSAEVIQKYPVKLIQQPNAGSANARNNGILASHTKYVCCLDADDWILPLYLQTCVDVLEQDRSIGIAYTGMKTWHPDGSAFDSFWPREFNYEDQLAGKNQISSCCVFRRVMFDRLGGYRQRYAPKGTGADDAELWIRAGSIGFDAKLATRSMLYNYNYGTGISSQEGYYVGDWLAWHPWAKDRQYPFASIAKPAVYSHPVRRYDSPIIGIVIVVNEGQEHLIVDPLDSLEAQTMRRWEAVVVWNSLAPIDDYTRNAFPFARFVEVPAPGMDIKHAYGIGVRKCRVEGEPIFFMGADDWLYPDALEVALISQHDREVVASRSFKGSFMRKKEVLK